MRYVVGLLVWLAAGVGMSFIHYLIRPPRREGGATTTEASNEVEKQAREDRP